MDEKDLDIIQLLQKEFPIEPEPYKVIGDKLWLSEVSVVSRIAHLMQTGVIRYLGPFFDGKKLGFASALAAINVPEESIDKTAEIINRYPEVTHNYLRQGSPNMWFTIISSSLERQNQIITEIKRDANISEVLLFGSKRFYKAKVELKRERG